jgi:transposase
MLAELVDVVIGVDTHKHTHTAAVLIAGSGAPVDERTVACDPEGYAELVVMADGHRGRRAWAIEGTGSYGAGLSRFLVERGEWVIEVERPARPGRRGGGAKSDRIDAVRAARDALGRDQLGEPRSRGSRAALAVLVVARRSAVDAAGDAQRQLHALVTTAPEALRARFRGQTTTAMIHTATRLRVNRSWDLETQTTARTLRTLARRSVELSAEADTHHAAIEAIVADWRPDLLDQPGVGPIVAAVVLCAWSHPGRCRNDAAFANLAGVAPIPASSGLTHRHRLNHGGDRQLNRALHVIALSRLRHDPATQAYAQRRRAQGKNNREIRRCLKRYIARQIYRQLEAGPPTSP